MNVESKARSVIAHGLLSRITGCSNWLQLSQKVAVFPLDFPQTKSICGDGTGNKADTASSSHPKTVRGASYALIHVEYNGSSDRH
jgi:hypothetical protein